MTQWVNVSGVWKKVVTEYARVGGNWRQVTGGHVNVSGTNRFYTTTPTLQFLASYDNNSNLSSYTFNNVPLGTEAPNRRILAFVTNDYGPTGNLDLTQTWNVGGTNYATSFVTNSLGPGFFVSNAFTYYVDRQTVSLSDVIPTGATGNYTLTISTNGAFSYGVGVSFYALYDFTNTTATVSRSGSTTSTLTVSNIQPGTAFVGYTVNRASTVFPTLTGSSLSGTLRDQYGRSLGSGNPTYSSIYTFAHTGTNVIASETFTSNGGGTAGDSRIILIRYR